MILEPMGLAQGLRARPATVVEFSDALAPSRRKNYSIIADAAEVGSALGLETDVSLANDTTRGAR